MAKQGMKRPERTHTQSHNAAKTVPEIQGKAKSGKKCVRPIIAGTTQPAQKVYHTKPFASTDDADKPISAVYAEIDSDLARDNLENDIPAADLQDL